VTVVALCEVDPPDSPPVNPLEISEIGLFTESELPAELALSQTDMLADALRGDGGVVFE
jgi:hypothetical protein